MPYLGYEEYNRPPLTPPPPRPRAHPALIWSVAAVTGVVVYVLLVVVHLHRDGPGNDAFKAGEVMPPALVTTVAVALLAQFALPGGRPWQWLVPAAIPVVIAGGAFCWYAVVHVLPDVVNDAKAEANGQADYRLKTPAHAAGWTRLDGKAATRRREQALEMVADTPELSGTHPIYAEYRGHDGRLVFFGFNPSERLKRELRRSTDRAVADALDGAGATGIREVDEGELGGSMSCADGVESGALPADLVLCEWADASTMGQVYIVVHGVDIPTAADWTRDFRAEITRR